MKIEKINDNQIRCMLNSSDLRSRKLSLIELAYGSEKARQLFQEMMETASAEVGFQAEDVPLMIEAIPLTGESIMLIITKIDDPEELDTRFARFAPGIEDGAMPEAESFPDPFSVGSASDILEAFQQLLGGAGTALPAGSSQDSKEHTGSTAALPEILCVYCFDRLDPLLEAAAVLKDFYVGQNSLYRNPSDGKYYLAVHKSGHSPEEFNKVCNILTEFGRRIHSNSATETYYREHYRLILADRALQQMAE